MNAPFGKSTNIEADPDATLASNGVESAAQVFIDRAFGDFKLIDEIARGGMGVVFRARQLSLNRIVALKMTLAGQFARPEDVQRFRSEAEAAAGLDHSNILPVYEVGSVQGQPFFAMKLVEGGSLATELKKRYPASESSEHQTLQKKIAVLKSVFASDSVAPLVQMLVPVAKAVHFAHQRGILHRDLKPGNILIDVDGTPYVTDFGLAKRVEGDASLTQTGAVVGTPSYMAPEQARAEKQLTTAVDVYSLGAILYEALTGRPPFRAATVMETIMQVLEEEPEPPTKLAPGADRDLAVIAMKCLEKEPSRRYSSAAEFAAELERWLKGESIQARQVGNVWKTWRWAKRRPIMASVAAGLVVLAIGGTATITRLYFRAVERRQQVMEDLNRLTMERDTALRQLQRTESSERRAKHLHYSADMALAAMALDMGDTAKAKRLLNEHRRTEAAQTDLRGFEWHYLNRLIRSGLPSGPKKMDLLDREQFPIAAGPFFFSADSRFLIGNRTSASSQTPGTRIDCWDAATGRLDNERPGGYSCWAASRRPDRLAILKSTTTTTGRIWNPATKTLDPTPFILDGSTNHNSQWILDPLARVVVGQIQSKIIMRNLATQRDTVLLSNRSLTEFSLLEFTSQGDSLVGFDAQGHLYHWETATGIVRQSPKLGIEPIGQSALDPELRQVYFVGADGALYQLDVFTEELQIPFSGLAAKNRALFITPDRRRLFSWLTAADESQAIAVWDMVSEREVLKLPIAKGRVHAVDLSPDGTKLAVHLDDNVLIWDATPIPE